MYELIDEINKQVLPTLRPYIEDTGLDVIKVSFQGAKGLVQYIISS